MGLGTTIFAVSTPFAKSAIAVVRIAGPLSKNIYTFMTNLKSTPPSPRTAILTNLFKVEDKTSLIDSALSLWFPAPHSFTGSDCVELHLHGSVAVIRDVLDNLGKIPGFSPAEPGSFTRMAFDNDKLDLCEIDGLADLLAAETSLQRDLALLNYKGIVGSIYNQWIASLTESLSILEAYIDFQDEDHRLENEDILDGVEDKVLHLRKEMMDSLQFSETGERIRNGFRIALIGMPNVGKSSLLNLLIKRKASIVSPVAGTTRDAIEVNFNIDGIPVVFIDTAGIRLNSTMDAIESEGIEISKEKMKEADLILHLIDCGNINNDSCDSISLTSENGISSKTAIVYNKSDLLSKENRHTPPLTNGHVFNCSISCISGDGLEKLLIEISSFIKNKYLLNERFSLGNNNVIGLTRHVFHIKKNLSFIDGFLKAKGDGAIDIATDELRMAMREISKISGKIIDCEEILDEIFKRFCIGK